jgi:hypothetical protein
LAEVQQAVKQMRNRKAPGVYEITINLIKAGRMAVFRWLHGIFMNIWKSEEIVQDWPLAILIRLFQNKGDKKNCDNYRGISLLVVANNIFFMSDSQPNSTYD